MSRELHETGPVLSAVSGLDLLRSLAAEQTCHLVGGSIRDALLNRPLSDIDIATSTDPTHLARRFASDLCGHWFWLDQDRLQSRVLVEVSPGENQTFDFTPFRGPTLQDDLIARDYTINAMAIPLQSSLSSSQIIDPLNGIKDLAGKCLRMTSEQALVDDPLRILKGLRHAAELSLEVEQETLNTMHTHGCRLADVAVERTRIEVWRLLKSAHEGEGLSFLQLSGIGKQFWGEGFEKSWLSMQQQIEICRERWSKLVNEFPILQHWLDQDAEAGLDRMTLILWTLALHQIEPGLSSQQAQSWRFSRKAQQRITALGNGWLSIWDEFDRIAPRSRSWSLWATEQSIDLHDAILTAVCTHKAPLDTLRRWLERHLPLIEDWNCQNRVPDLVNGHWLQARFPSLEDERIGHVLSMLRWAEIEGKVYDEKGAQVFLQLHCRDCD